MTGPGLSDGGLFVLQALARTGARVVAVTSQQLHLECPAGHRWQAIRAGLLHSGWASCPECRRASRGRPLRMRSLPTSASPAEPTPRPTPRPPAPGPADRLIAEADTDLALGASTSARRR